MANILCIESGTDICSVALASDGELVSLRESEAVRNHSRDLAMYVQEIFEQNDLDPSADIDAVAVGAGPGSYTGLRISASVAKGLCFGLGKPLIAVDSLLSLASTALEEYQGGIFIVDDPSSALLVPMLDARRMEVYTAVYDMNLQEVEPTSAHILEENSFAKYGGRELLFFGDGAQKAYDLLSPCNDNVCLRKVSSSARGLVRLAQQRFDAGCFVDVAYWEPFYLKEFMIK